jgi:hypothetical protein
MERALNELHNAQLHLMPKDTHAHTKRSGGLSLTGACVNNQQTLFFLGSGFLLFKTLFMLFAHAFVRFLIRFQR